MAYKCDNCGRGKGYGHMVSHAKNRLLRVFKPNLQKLKVLKGSVVVRVKFCTSCIKRLRKDGRVGSFNLLKFEVAKAEILPKKIVSQVLKEEKAKKVKTSKEATTKAKETLDIASIVGLPAGKAGKKN